MKDYITAKERMQNLIISKKWKWRDPKYNTNNKNKKRNSNEFLNNEYIKNDTSFNNGSIS